MQTPGFVSRRTRKQYYLPGKVVISSKPGHLDKLEEVSGEDAMVGKEIKTALKPTPLRDSAPQVYSHDGKTWKKVKLQGDKPAEFTGPKAIHNAFKKYQTAKGITTRRYSFDRAKAISASHHAEKTQERVVADTLSEMLNKPHELKVTGFDVRPDHIFKHTVGGMPGDSPAEIPARTGIPEDGKSPDELFKQQALWTTIGAESATREKFEGQGEGVTVVIFDTAPALEKISPKLVDYYIAMKGPDGEIEPPDGRVRVERRERHSVGRPTPTKEELVNRPGGEDIDHDKMQPYHGLMIASLIRELAPKATIILLEVLDDNGETSGSNLTEALDYILFWRDKNATANGKKLIGNKLVLNLSLGYPDSLAEDVEVVYLLEACERACKSGALIVAAAGNDSFYMHPRNPEEPAAYGYYLDDSDAFAKVIAVSATAKPGEYMLYSNQGNLAAPGMDLLMNTGDPQNPGGTQYVYWAGTSFAAPLVTASAALLMSNGVAAEDVKQRLWDGATHYKSWNAVPELHIGRSLDAKA